MVKKTASRKKKKTTTRRKTRKKASRKKKSTEVVYHSTKEIKVEKALIENFIGLQKVLVNLSGKFDNLSTQISKLLDLFEISAKALAKKEFSSSENPEAKKMMEKLDRLHEHTGLIGKGLVLMNEVGKENPPEQGIRPMMKPGMKPMMKPGMKPPMKPMPRPPQQPGMPEEKIQDISGYQKSIPLRELDSR